MKKLVCILLCTLLLAGCTEEASVPTILPVETTAEPTAVTTMPVETTVPAPETVSATALTDKTCVLIATADRGAAIDVVGEHADTYYIVKTEQGYGLVEKSLVRLESQEAYAQWTGYALNNVAFYNNYHLLGEPVETLNMNAELQVLEDVGCCLVVQCGENIGYMRAGDVSKSFIVPAPGGGGSADGGDISLSGRVVLLSEFIPQEGEVTGKGTVLVDDAEIILGWFDRGEAVPVIVETGYAPEKEGWIAVYFEGRCGYVRRDLLREEGQEVFAQWNGFSTYKAPLYDNYYLSGEPVAELPANGEIQVLEDLGNCFMVTCGEVTGYLAKENASESKINYGGGGNSGGEWTPPAL